MRHALLLGGAMVALWVLMQATALVPSATASIQEADSTQEADSLRKAASPQEVDSLREAASSQNAVSSQKVVSSEEDGVTARSTSSHSGVGVFTWGNTIAVLLLVGGGGYAFYLNRRGSTPTAPSMFEPMGQLSLGQSQQLRLVACGGEVLLLGVTTEEVTLLKTFPRDDFDDARRFAEAKKDANETLPAAASMPTGFSDVLKRVLRQNASA